MATGQGMKMRVESDPSDLGCINFGRTSEIGFLKQNLGFPADYCVIGWHYRMDQNTSVGLNRPRVQVTAQTWENFYNYCKSVHCLTLIY